MSAHRFAKSWIESALRLAEAPGCCEANGRQCPVRKIGEPIVKSIHYLTMLAFAALACLGLPRTADSTPPGLARLVRGKLLAESVRTQTPAQVGLRESRTVAFAGVDNLAVGHQ